MRTPAVIFALGGLVACASIPTFGSLGEGATETPTIASVDTAFPPRTASVQLDREAFAVVLLVAPGHSATVLYPPDSTTNNRLAAGAHEIALHFPASLVRVDTGPRPARMPIDSVGRARPRSSIATTPALPPLEPTAPTYLLLVTAQQPLTFSKVNEKTAGWSIPLDDLEALNSVAKNIKSTLPREPRAWAGFYRQVTLRPIDVR